MTDDAIVTVMVRGIVVASLVDTFVPAAEARDRFERLWAKRHEPADQRLLTLEWDCHAALSELKREGLIRTEGT